MFMSPDLSPYDTPAQVRKIHQSEEAVSTHRTSHISVNSPVIPHRHRRRDAPEETTLALI